MGKVTAKDLTVIYYTSNHLEDTNPYFLGNTWNQLMKAIDDLPIIVVSQKPISEFLKRTDILKPQGELKNIVVGDIGRSHLNIYKQIMIGAKEAQTPLVAMAEDDILYSHNHFHSEEILKEHDNHPDHFLYDMNKVSLFTWTEPPMFSFRSKRKVVNQLISPSKMLAEAMEERFKRVDELLASGKPLESIIKYFGDPGRYEKLLGVTERKSLEFYSNDPSIVFSHPEAYGYLSQGKRKRLGDIRIIELYQWGRAEDIVKLYEQ